jgi:hypothetical protein
MITPAQDTTALGLPATGKILIDCSGQPDGQWDLAQEAENEIDGSL